MNFEVRLHQIAWDGRSPAIRESYRLLAIARGLVTLGHDYDGARDAAGVKQAVDEAFGNDVQIVEPWQIWYVINQRV